MHGIDNPVQEAPPHKIQTPLRLPNFALDSKHNMVNKKSARDACKNELDDGETVSDIEDNDNP